MESSISWRRNSTADRAIGPRHEPQRHAGTAPISDVGDGPKKDDEFALNLTYRAAYGLASAHMDREMYGPNAPGRDPAAQFTRLVAEVSRELGDDGRARE